jgi:hypothetical protein
MVTNSILAARRTLVRFIFAGGLIAGAATLWLSGGSAGQAETAPATQGVTAAVASTISWGSSGTCTQNMPTAAFGTLAAGDSNTVGGFRGCVTSNKTWSVAARMSTPLTSTDDGSTIDGSALKLTNTTAPGTNRCPAATPCALSASTATNTTILTGAPKASKAFEYSLTLTVPATATGGTYTDGTLTFTASN